MRVLLLVERALSDAVRVALEREGHAVALTHSGTQAVQMARATLVDGMVVDAGLPLDAFKMVRAVRASGVRVPILLLIPRTALRQIDQVQEAGADDFLLKPFTLPEFTARVRLMLGRHLPKPSRLHFGRLEMQLDTREVFRDGAAVTLTPREFQLLEILLRSAGRVVPRRDLIRALWDDEPIEGNTLDAFIALLRKKIDRDGAPRLIETVRGVGYRLSR